MNIEAIRQAGISRSSRRWISNPLRRLAWRLINPYVAALVGAFEDRIATIERNMGTMLNLSDRAEIMERHCSFSQSGEDRITAYIFERLAIASSDIRYLDIGAATPVDHNNTYLFYRNGGQGVSIEADPKYLEDHRKIRPRDQLGHFAVVPEHLIGSGSIDFHLAVDQGWSSVDLQHVRLAEKLGKGGLRETITVPTITIGNLLSKYFENKTLHLLSIDIEGFDSEVVMEINFEKFRPLVIIIESPNQDTTDFLIEKKYKSYASTYINKIFVEHKTFEDLLNKM